MAKGLRIHEKYLDEIKRNLNNQIKLVDEKLEKDLQAVQNSGQGGSFLLIFMKTYV